MICSRDPKTLEANVYANVLIGMDLASAAGYPVAFDCTLRDQEYQTYLYEQGIAPRSVAFHAFGLAFDIRWKGSKTPYASMFYNVVAPIFKKIGFTWMQDIIGSDGCHFQWDDHRQITTKMVRDGRLPPPMPLYKETDLMSQFIEDMATKYSKTTKEVETALETILKIALHTPAEWENKGERILFTSGLTTSEHKANEIVTFGILGTMEGRRK
jgi:hypothetical protein